MDELDELYSMIDVADKAGDQKAIAELRAEIQAIEAGSGQAPAPPGGPAVATGGPGGASGPAPAMGIATPPGAPAPAPGAAYTDAQGQFHNSVGRIPKPGKALSATEGIHPAKLFAEGMGQSVDSTLRGVNQLGHFLFNDREGYDRLRDEEAETRKVDEALLDTGAGRSGQITGHVLQALMPVGAGVKAASTGGKLAVNAGLGALESSLGATTKDENRAENAMYGGLIGGGMGLGWQALSSGARLYSDRKGAALRMIGKAINESPSATKIKAAAGKRIDKLTKDVNVPLDAIRKELGDIRDTYGKALSPTVNDWLTKYGGLEPMVTEATQRHARTEARSAALVEAAKIKADAAIKAAEIRSRGKPPGLASVKMKSDELTEATERAAQSRLPRTERVPDAPVPPGGPKPKPPKVPKGEKPTAVQTASAELIAVTERAAKAKALRTEVVPDAPVPPGKKPPKGSKVPKTAAPKEKPGLANAAVRDLGEDTPAVQLRKEMDAHLDEVGRKAIANGENPIEAIAAAKKKFINENSFKPTKSGNPSFEPAKPGPAEFVARVHYKVPKEPHPSYWLRHEGDVPKGSPAAALRKQMDDHLTNTELRLIGEGHDADVIADRMVSARQRFISEHTPQGPQGETVQLINGKVVDVSDKATKKSRKNPKAQALERAGTPPETPAAPLTKKRDRKKAANQTKAETKAAGTKKPRSVAAKANTSASVSDTPAKAKARALREKAEATPPPPPPAATPPPPPALPPPPPKAAPAPRVSEGYVGKPPPSKGPTHMTGAEAQEVRTALNREAIDVGGLAQSGVERFRRAVDDSTEEALNKSPRRLQDVLLGSRAKRLKRAREEYNTGVKQDTWEPYARAAARGTFEAVRKPGPKQEYKKKEK